MDELVSAYWADEILAEPIRVNSKGYALLRKPDCPLTDKSGWVYRCRYVMWCLGKLTDPQHQVVHHRNFRKLDDRPENLEVLTAGAHAAYHGRVGKNARGKRTGLALENIRAAAAKRDNAALGARVSATLKRRYAAGELKVVISEEQREQTRLRRLGTKWPEEMKQHFSEVHKGKKQTDEAKQKVSKAMTGRTITWGDKISATLKARGIKPPGYDRRGRTLPEETKAKLSASVRESWNGRREQYEARRDEWIGLEYMGAKRVDIARAYDVSPASITRVLGAR